MGSRRAISISAGPNTIYPSAKLSGVLIEYAARAGVSAFGADIDIQYSELACTQFGLVKENAGTIPSSYNEIETVACGCPNATELCKVTSPGLSPPK